VEEDVKDRACDMRERRVLHVGYWWESQEERDLDWIDLTQDRALVNMVINLRVPLNV
jgi:hypothetical protein